MLPAYGLRALYPVQPVAVHASQASRTGRPLSGNERSFHSGGSVFRLTDVRPNTLRPRRHGVRALRRTSVPFNRRRDSSPWLRLRVISPVSIRQESVRFVTTCLSALRDEWTCPILSDFGLSATTISPHAGSVKSPPQGDCRPLRSSTMYGSPRWFRVPLVVLIVSAMHPAHAQSFGCRKASTAAQHTICREPGISELDWQLAEALNNAPRVQNVNSAHCCAAPTRHAVCHPGNERNLKERVKSELKMRRKR